MCFSCFYNRAAQNYQLANIIVALIEFKAVISQDVHRCKSFIHNEYNGCTLSGAWHIRCVFPAPTIVPTLAAHNYQLANRIVAFIEFKAVISQIKNKYWPSLAPLGAP